MKKLFTLFILGLFISSAIVAQDAKPAKESISKVETPAVQPESGAKMTFTETHMDYGKIEKNSDGARVFTYVNDGTEPLIISNAKGSCGCTVPKYDRDIPILPGETKEIKVTYDTKRVGPFRKSVRIWTNVKEDPIVITIGGEVLAEPAGLPEKKEGNVFGN